MHAVLVACNWDKLNSYLIFLHAFYGYIDLKTNQIIALGPLDLNIGRVTVHSHSRR